MQGIAAPELCEPQRAVEDALEGRSVRVGAFDLAPHQLFAALHGLAGLMLLAGTDRELLVELDVAREAFAAHVTERERLDAERRSSSADHRRAKRTRAVGNVPQDPALAAAVVGSGWRILADDDPVAALRPLVEALRSRVSGLLQVTLARASLPPELARAAGDAAEASSRRKSHVTRASSSESGARVRPEQVPPYLQPDLVAALQPLVPDLRLEGLQAFASMAIVRTAGGYSTWAEAGCALGLDDDLDVARAPNNAQTRMNGAGRADEAWAYLENVARRIAGAEDPVDWAERRRRFADLTQVPHKVLEACGLRPSPARSRLVAACAWELLVARPAWRAPALAHLRRSTAVDTLTQLERRLGDAARVAIDEWARSLLEPGEPLRPL